MTDRKSRFGIALGLALAMALPLRPAHAADAAPAAGGPFDARETMGTILVGGLVGGILGLSTLSFYEKPQDHIQNITIGAATGMIITTLYLTFSMASSGRMTSVETPSLLVSPWAEPTAGGVFAQYRF